MRDNKTLFVPPETFGDAASFSEANPVLDLSGMNAWDIATRYHEFKAKPGMAVFSKDLRRLSAQAILERAQVVLGSLVHPMEQKSCPLSELPGDALHPDIELDETLENAPLSSQDIWMSYQTHRKQPLVLSVDTSLSMTGEKLALTAVALAVVLLQFPEDPIGIVAFENEAKILKEVTERITLTQLVERFLDVPAQGYTHLEDGLRAALRLVNHHKKEGRPASTVLLTDGKYTAGRDPAYLASRFPHLVVLKMGHEKASLPLCREMARKGRGSLREVARLATLPIAMYSVVKDLLRGHSV